MHSAALLLLLVTAPFTAAAHGGKHVNLHVDPKWSQCSFQLDPSLTQQAWREFTGEGGMVAYFRPLTDAAPMGTGMYELSIVQWNTAFDDTKAAWNDTFVHPDSAHWLKEGERLGFPALMFRAGITDRIDAGLFWTKSPGANYGFWGGQLQYNLFRDAEQQWAASARLTVSSIFGPEDIDLTTYGIDILASKRVDVYEEWCSLVPYAGASAYLTRAHEKSIRVNLRDESIAGLQAMVGTEVHLSFVRLAAEYNIAVVSTFSMKIGVDF
jgi:hypothetical protein